jgi:protein involved in polysaccharide export with SLBB domain
MKTGERWSSWKSWSAALLALLPLLLSAPGCAKDRASVGKNLRAQENALFHGEIADRYRLGCPDIVELSVPSRPELNGRYQVQPEGRIELENYGKLRVEGKTPLEAAKLVAEETGVDQEKVEVRVAEYRSQHLLLFGEVIGWQRSVSYRGPETVLDLLRRVGGITPGAEPKDVYVLRPHLGDNQRPEAFHVDLHAIVLKHDHKTNIRLQPFDQVYVGETRKAQIEKAVPPWLRAAYQAIWDTKPVAAKERDETQR